MMRRLITVMAMVTVCAADAQIALPPVQVPPLPPVKLPSQLPAIDRTLSDATATVDPRRLVGLRAARVRDLLRRHRNVVEADPQGAPAVRAEVVAFAPSDEALERARAAGFAVVREQVLEGLGAKTVVLRAPRGMATRKALQKLKELDGEGVYDFNHIYLESGVVQAGSKRRNVAQAVVRSESPGNGPSIKVGLIDGGIDLTHPAFVGKTVQSYGCAGKPVAGVHGTAVASLLAGRADNFRGAAPDAELYAADVYCGVPAGGAVDTIADAFAWLARQRVGVINVSLVGPPNAALERIVRLVLARGHIVVAAVGNDGPDAPPLYPAAYPGVVGVTGVDGKRRVLLEALRGEQVDFAAPGADLAAANGAHSFGSVRGTSFAAPIVAGLLALELREPDTAAAQGVIDRLANGATDLGERGRDRVYGHGFVSINQ